MKKTIKLAVVAALALGATSAFATNGDVMIGQGAKSRAMGGVGIAKSFGAESGLANPAMIASVEKSEALLVVTAFAPSVAFASDTASNAGMGAAPVEADSGANFSVIPEIAYATRINENTVVGLSVSGTAGMGTDYGDNTTNGAFKMKTSLGLLKVAVPVSYTVGGFTAGIAGILQYGTLEMSHQNGAGFTGMRENGVASDVGYGLEAGVAYDMKGLGVKGLTLGAVYKSKIGMNYDNTLSASMADFGVDAASRQAATGQSADAITSGDNLAQPEERGVGISYTMGENTISADYKNIAWGDAAGYSDFGWENQDVYALGYEYATKGWALRAGYNYAKSPIAEQNGGKSTTQAGTNYVGAVKNFFNLSGFPGIVETHFTIGGSYTVSDALSFDGSFIYVPEVSNSFDTSGMTEAWAYDGAFNTVGSPSEGDAAASNTAALSTPASSADVTHSQMALTLAVSYKF